MQNLFRSNIFVGSVLRYIFICTLTRTKKNRMKRNTHATIRLKIKYSNVTLYCRNERFIEDYTPASKKRGILFKLYPSFRFCSKQIY